jgi:hypothetical protein
MPAIPSRIAAAATNGPYMAVVPSQGLRARATLPHGAKRVKKCGVNRADPGAQPRPGRRSATLTSDYEFRSSLLGMAAPARPFWRRFRRGSPGWPAVTCRSGLGAPAPEGPPGGRPEETGVPDRARAREERTGLAGAGVALGWETPAGTDRATNAVCARLVRGRSARDGPRGHGRWPTAQVGAGVPSNTTRNLAGSRG